MLFIVFLTAKCNLRCKYCGGLQGVMPNEITYPIEKLVDFISQDDNPSIAFYGGEPFLRLDLMKRIMDSIDAEHYIVQTNGLRLSSLEQEYLNRFSTILVSIDGRKEVTDYYRGKGVYDTVLRNVKAVKDCFEGELIARMVATQKTDIYEDVTHLLNLNLFTHVHWQIDAVWSADGIWYDFKGWVEEYNKGISKLVRLWLSELEKGRVLGIVPFLGVLKALLGFRNSAPPCGSGVDLIAITTDGKVVACPICADLDWNVLGDLNTDLDKLKKVKIGKPCPNCEYFGVCGGRCLFFNKERLWGDEGFKLVCSTVKHLIEEIKKAKPRILELVDRGVIKFEDLIYPKFNNTTEIIP